MPETLWGGWRQITKVSHMGTQCPSKSPGPQGLNVLLWLAVLLMLSHVLAGSLSTVCTTSLGENDWDLALGPSWTPPYTHFPFADFNLYPFTAMNYSHDQDCMLSPGGTASESSNLQGVRGAVSWSPPETHIHKAWFKISSDLSLSWRNEINFYRLIQLHCSSLSYT